MPRRSRNTTTTPSPPKKVIGNGNGHNGNSSTTSNGNKKYFLVGMILGSLITFCWEDLIMTPKILLVGEQEQQQLVEGLGGEGTRINSITPTTTTTSTSGTTLAVEEPPPHSQQQSFYHPQPAQDLLRTSIRRWGCLPRCETPFIFVHIGKAGGGLVRSRIASSALNYSTTIPWNLNYPNSYYLINTTTTTTDDHTTPQQTQSRRKGYFANSCFSAHKPSREKSYEGTIWCHATTPIGQAIACPEPLQKYQNNPYLRAAGGECHPSATTCRLVYVGHNWLGAEMHWLPPQYLQNWWNNQQLNYNSKYEIPWYKLNPNNTWCDDAKISRPLLKDDHKKLYEQCSIPLARQIDSIANLLVSSQQSNENENAGLVVQSWAPIYASLPLLRATVLRDPFPWLMSKFFWHRLHQSKSSARMTCDNITQAIGYDSENDSSTAAVAADVPRRQVFRHEKDDGTIAANREGWLTNFCFSYLFFLCGEDCATRYSAGQFTLGDIEKQAEENLRHSFVVVGILEDPEEEFYEMLDARIQYIDTRLHASHFEKGQQHKTSQQGEALRCKEKYTQDKTFQQRLLKASPELRALKRLYDIGKQVKQFQKEEMEQCANSKDNNI